MTDARTKPAGSESAPDIGVEPGYDVEFAQLANGDAFRLRHGRNQDVRASLVWKVHSGSPKGAAVPAPVRCFNLGEIEVNPVGRNPERILQQFTDLLGKHAIGLAV